MKIKSTKAAWIRAFKLTLDEYKAGTHINSTDACAKCKIGYRYFPIDGSNCVRCIEYIFGNDDSYCCLQRPTYPTHRFYNTREEGIQAAIKYHIQAIKILKKIPAKYFVNIAENIDKFSELKNIKID